MKPLLWTDKPVQTDADAQPGQEAKNWEQAVYPIGNGRLGGTAFGEPACERFQFNEDSLWVGNEDNTGAYQPFGDIYIEQPHAEYSDYRRELDISRAVQTITYVSGGVKYTREYFSSYPAQVVVLRISADKPGALSGCVRMGNLHEIPVVTEGDTLVMKGDTSNFYYWQMLLKERDRLIAGREYASDQIIELDFEARCRVMHEGGEVKAADDGVAFEGCDTVTLLLAADTNYVADRAAGWRGPHPHAHVSAQIDAAASQDYMDLLAAHVADYQALYGRVSLAIGDTEASVTDRSTPARVEAYRDCIARGAAPTDHDLEVLLYQYARYLMISSSRDGHGGLPTNLQGIWSIKLHPAWRCDFHTDVNIQMNYWFADGAALPECFLPLPQWVDSIREVRKEETRKVLGVERGWLMRSENGIFGGSTWHIQKGDSAWLCQNLWDHYAYSQDRGYLERYAYPVMREISEFWIDHLKELPDGTLVSPEGRSPEHGPVGVDGVTYDQSLCWDLWTNTIDASAVLGVDPELREELIAKRANLLGPQVGKWGQLQEWMEDIDDPEDDHRHINHLIGLYPGRQIRPTLDSEIAGAAMTGLCARRDHGQGHPGWSRVWKACMFARLLDGDSAYGQLAETLGTHIYGNLWAVHPPFQIDANFGFAAAVNEMLVQSWNAEFGTRNSESASKVQLLPALPEAWGDGSVEGLRVRGGFEVSLAWEGGSLTRATVRNICSEACAAEVSCDGKSLTVELAKGGEQTFEAADFS